ncbi:MAG: hypothetical protein RR721_04250 [Aeromonas sp.]|uniref:hypothetical protein n=1 Tax=Aeromonas sp. TaxID=647 RepID=UPI002FC62CDE
MDKKELAIAELLSDRPLRLRKAILEETADCSQTRPVTSDDVRAKWPLLQGVGLSNYDIVRLANGPDVDPERFKELMESLRSSL